VSIAVGLIALLQSFRNDAEDERRGYRLRTVKNLAGLALALRQYEKEHGHLPPAAVFDKNGNALLSWRVLLLPQLEREGVAEKGLFNQFNLDEAWDSPTNLPLLNKMPLVFTPQRIGPAAPCTTNYLVFVGKGTAFQGPKGVDLRGSDHREQTLLIVEASQAIPWTKPEDLPYLPDNPLPPLGPSLKEGAYAALLDGSVVSLAKMQEKTLRAHITGKPTDEP
jgi:hypothetical protein